MCDLLPRVESHFKQVKLKKVLPMSRPSFEVNMSADLAIFEDAESVMVSISFKSIPCVNIDLERRGNQSTPVHLFPLKRRINE